MRVKRRNPTVFTYLARIYNYSSVNNKLKEERDEEYLILLGGN